MKLRDSVFFVVLIFAATITPVAALEIETDYVRNAAMVYLRGEFLPGDYEKFAHEIIRVNDSAGGALIHLNSSGGNLFEAKKVGTLIRDLGYHVYIEDDGVCASACFVVYALAMSRSALSGKVAIHRPYFSSKFYEDMSLSEALETHRFAIDQFRSILTEAGVPSDIVDLAVSRSSDDIHILSNEELARIGISPPWVEELLIAQCGYMAAQVRVATFGNSLPLSERRKWMEHRGNAYSCLHDLYRDNSRDALRRLRFDFSPPR